MSDNKSDENKKRKPPWILGGFIVLLFSFLFLLQASNLWKDFTVDSASDTIFLYALSTVNFIALIGLSFIFLRSLLKLRQERRTSQLGSKIKTRLLIYFFAVTLLPLIAMAAFSFLFMNRALDRWFIKTPENVINEAKRLQKESTAERRKQFTESVGMIATLLDEKDLEEKRLQRILEVGSLTYAEVISAEGKTLLSSVKNISTDRKKELNKTLDYVHKNNLDASELNDGVGFDAITAEMSDGKKLVVVPDFSFDQKINDIAVNSLRNLDDLKDKQRSIRQIGLTTLGLLTLLLIFATSWIAFHIAKGLTRPIRALAEGASEIAQGNLGYQVDVIAEDELDLLVKAFNKMSGKLEENSDELKNRRHYIETILQSLSTGVISFDVENRVTTINKAAIQMFKLGDEDFLGFDLKRLVNKENYAILERLISRAKRIGHSIEQTALQKETKNGSIEKEENLQVALTATVLPNEAGTVVVIEDLTELIAAQRATAWQEVARRMAHEIKNPLTPIQLSAERIAKRFAENNEVEKNTNGSNFEEEEIKSLDSKNEKQKVTGVIKSGTETILREVSSLKSMVDEFSRFARLPDAKLESGDLNEILQKTVILYEDRITDVKINVKLDEHLPQIMLDEEQLKRVFVNLIDNSIEAFDENQEDKAIFVKTLHDSARGLIIAEVSDNGKGIPPSGFQKLFQPYFSTKGRGTGLGLAIVQRIVSEHSGKIKAVQNTPKGAKFIVELPTNV